MEDDSGKVYINEVPRSDFINKISLRDGSLDALTLLADNHDTFNHTINEIIYVYAMGIKDAAANTSLLSMMTYEINNDNGYGVSILDVANNNTTFKNILENSMNATISQENLQHLISGKPSEQNITEYLAGQLIYNNDTYLPVIYTITPDPGSSTSPPYIVIGEEVTDENDAVLAWGIADTIPFLLDEPTALKCNRVNIYVGPGITTGPPGGGPPTGSDLDTVTVTFRSGDVKIKTDRFQIKSGHRYERSRKSEIKTWVEQYGGDFVLLHSWFDNFYPSREIHKNDINSSKIVNETNKVTTIDEDYFNSEIKVWYGAWEYDWYVCNKKRIYNPCDPAYYVDLKMKYSHEYYFIECGIANNLWQTVSDTYKSENTKCMFELKRTN